MKQLARSITAITAMLAAGSTLAQVERAYPEGFITGTSLLGAAGTAPANDALAAPAAVGEGIEVVFRPDPHILDGRHANNGWL